MDTDLNSEDLSKKDQLHQVSSVNLSNPMELDADFVEVLIFFASLTILFELSAHHLDLC